MNRRESLKAIGLGTLSTTVLLGACNTPDKTDKTAADAKPEAVPGRQPYEVARENKLKADTFFTDHEMATIAVLADIIIPKDEKSGSATDAKVPDFIEFIVKDIPDHQLPMRGGLRWLDMQCLNRYNNAFIKCTKAQQLELIDQIAYPTKAKPEMQQGVAFFNRMRDLTATGFFTSEMGVKDIGYAGNQPNKWTGVPPDVLKKYGMEQLQHDMYS
ncbi:gluconate 2-dehydrogenase subunit 3 family protein [Mucilaginibacter segetis]|uniref:Gluconate 2-dehydrogenase subunit 3 family protein n=1 Tax=Mucilaginibacter segetis TaxID=2793071 RepID=A0A934PUQ2_9SPHI|nr:gluconate 2-dehydrogenase subunit 3 family protein [Mucilaginibacter segetis]MBK0379892.1 gluconate 2-dehydrogenase subunit 3 family protein [Mucilaginibacter segetis]